MFSVLHGKLYYIAIVDYRLFKTRLDKEINIKYNRNKIKDIFFFKISWYVVANRILFLSKVSQT